VNVGVRFDEVVVEMGAEMEVDVDVDGDAEKGWDV
jgi:hypothetical protein